MPFPRNEPEVNTLLQIWAVKLPAYKTQFNLTDDLIDQEVDDSTLYNHLITARKLLEEDVGEVSAYWTNMSAGDPLSKAAAYPTVSLLPPPAPVGAYKPGIEKRNQELYNFIKNHPNRTAESLADLGITGSAKTPVPPESLKPKLKGGAMANDKVEIVFNKQGQKICRIQMRRGGGSWNTVADPDSVPYIDETPSVGGNPEKREYRGIYLQKNNPVGQYSDIIVIVTTP